MTITSLVRSCTVIKLSFTTVDGVVGRDFSGNIALVLACSLYTTALGKTEERRKLFSEASRPVLSLLADTLAKI